MIDIVTLEAMLPTERRSTTIDPRSLFYLGIAPPKFGKTTWFSCIPDSLLVAFERGFHFQTVPTIFIDVWDQRRGQFEPYQDEYDITHMTMVQLAEALVNSDKYKFIIFDTADMAAKKCTDFQCGQHGWTHATDGGDYGKGWDIAQNTPFRHMVNKILGTGRGVGFITHSQINTTDLGKGKKSKKETSLPSGIYKYLHAQADIILHGSFGVKQKGNVYRDRVWQTEGDEETLAGTRSRELILPAKFIIDPDKPWEQWLSFFENQANSTEAERQYMEAFRRKAPETPEEEPAPAQAENGEGKQVSRESAPRKKASKE